MEKNIILTVSRQYGSNGQEIARQLAERLSVGYYNKEIMCEIANLMGISPAFFEEDNRNAEGFFNIANNRRALGAMTELTVNSQVYEKSSELIQTIAGNESAVIVGRCADYILKDNPNCIKVYFYSKLEDRIRHAIQAYNVPVKKAARIVEDKDQRRARFYEFYANRKWGDPENYDLMINTSIMSVEDILEVLAHYYQLKKKP